MSRETYRHLKTWTDLKAKKDKKSKAREGMPNPDKAIIVRGKIKLSNTFTLTVRQSCFIDSEGKRQGQPVTEYYNGSEFLFGVLEPLTLGELKRLYYNGYFTDFKF